MTAIPRLAPLLPILPGYHLQPAMFHVIGNIKQSQKDYMLPYSVAGRPFSQIDAQFQFQPDKVKSFSSFSRLQ